jgi:hypothetical protein
MDLKVSIEEERRVATRDQHDHPPDTVYWDDAQERHRQPDGASVTVNADQVSQLALLVATPSERRPEQRGAADNVPEEDREGRKEQAKVVRPRGVRRVEPRSDEATEVGDGKQRKRHGRRDPEWAVEVRVRILVEDRLPLERQQRTPQPRDHVGRLNVEVWLVVGYVQAAQARQGWKNSDAGPCCSWAQQRRSGGESARHMAIAVSAAARGGRIPLPPVSGALSLVVSP